MRPSPTATGSTHTAPDSVTFLSRCIAAIRSVGSSPSGKARSQAPIDFSPRAPKPGQPQGEENAVGNRFTVPEPLILEDRL